MKTFVCILVFGCLVAGEPPLYRPGSFREVESKYAPYPAAGFRPQKEFNLPARQELTPPRVAGPPSTSYGIPDDSYSAPFKVYTAPQTLYGAPLPTNTPKTTEDDDSETVEAANISQAKKETPAPKKEAKKEEVKADAEIVSAKGVYYVLLPGSQLQRVQFTTENDVNNMAYTARLQYRDEDRAPIYLYTVPQSQVQQYQYQTSAYSLPSLSQIQQIPTYSVVTQNQIQSYGVPAAPQRQLQLPAVSQNQQSVPSYKPVLQPQQNQVAPVPQTQVSNSPVLSQPKGLPRPQQQNVPAQPVAPQVSSSYGAPLQSQFRPNAAGPTLPQPNSAYGIPQGSRLQTSGRYTSIF